MCNTAATIVSEAKNRQEICNAAAYEMLRCHAWTVRI